MDNSKEASNHFACTAELVRKAYGKGDEFAPHVQHLLTVVRSLVPIEYQRVVTIMELLACEHTLVTPQERLCFFAFCEALEQHQQILDALEIAENTWLLGFYPHMYLWNPACAAPNP